METRKRVLGQGHPDTLIAWAASHRKLGLWKGAEELEAQAMETRKIVHGQDPPDT